MKPHQSIDRGDGIVTVEGSPPNDTAARERQGYPAALGGFMDLALCGRGSANGRLSPVEFMTHFMALKAGSDARKINHMLIARGQLSALRATWT